jgi:hypothetical protein
MRANITQRRDESAQAFRGRLDQARAAARDAARDAGRQSGRQAARDTGEPGCA